MTAKNHEVEARRNAYENVKQADSLSETEFSGLFHVARTTTPDSRQSNGYSSVSVPVHFGEDGDYVVGAVVKTRRGEHYHVRNSNYWNAVISIPVKPFMETQVAKDEILRQIQGPLSL